MIIPGESRGYLPVSRVFMSRGSFLAVGYARVAGWRAPGAREGEEIPAGNGVFVPRGRGKAR